LCCITLNVFNLFLLLDLYAFIIGSYVIWTAVAGVRYSIEQVRKRRTSVLLNQIWKWCSIVVKSSALLSIWVRMILVADQFLMNPTFCWCINSHLFFGDQYVFFWFQIFVIPVLIGLLFELLVIVPMRVPVDESPVFLLYQDWALGLIFLKIWTRLVSLFP
jgi:E3 ubiquitin-protein ligase MARCH6